MIVAVRIRDGQVQQFSSEQEGCVTLKAQTRREELRVRNIRLALTGQRSHAYGYVWFKQETMQKDLPLDDLIARHARPNGRSVVATTPEGCRRVYSSIDEARRSVHGSWARVKEATLTGHLYKGYHWSLT